MEPFVTYNPIDRIGKCLNEMLIALSRAGYVNGAEECKLFQIAKNGLQG